MRDGAVRETFAARRSRVLSALGAEGALLVAAAPELYVGGDTDVRYVPSADLYYLTGYTEPEAVLVLCPSAPEVVTLFVRERDRDRERWTGVRGGVESARDAFGADAAYAIGELTQRLPALIAGATTLHAPLDSGRPEVDAAIRSALVAARRSRPRSGLGALTVTDPYALLAPMRVCKDEHEVAALRTAAAITVHAFENAVRCVGDASHEYVVEAAVEHAFRSRGAMGPAFPTIAAAGANATVLHYTANDAPLDRNDLILIDAGARAHMYCADVTRTIPIGGRFSSAQRAVYDMVLAAHDEAIANAVVGRTAADIDDAAVRVLALGMIELRLLKGPIDRVIEEREYRRYFPHRASHWLGLEIHDAGDYVVDGRPVPLAAGMVLTIEPGLYIDRDDDSAPEALRGIGVRIEDDILVTTAGPDILTGAFPVLPDAVESLGAS